MSNPNPATPPAPRWFAWFAAVVLLGYAVFLGLNFSPVAGGSDSSGYLNAAQLLANGHLTGSLRTGPGFEPRIGGDVQPLGFIGEPERGRLIPTYPLGLPLHLVLASKLAGWTVGPLLVGLGAALGAVILCYFAARELGLGWPLAAAGAVMLGVFPVTLYIAIQPLSDVLATTWTLAALYAALRARRSGEAWAVACGAALAVAVFVRPTNALFLPPLIVLLSRGWRPLAAAALGGLPGAMALAWFNHELYGSPWRMGYLSIFSAFSWSYFNETMIHFAHWLAVLLPAVLLVLPFALVRRMRRRIRELTALALWFLVPVFVYACYDISHQVWWCLRFILPAVPALIFAALLGLDVLLENRPRALPAAAAVLGLWATAASWYWTVHLNTLLVPTYERAYIEVSTWARTNLPANSVVVCLHDSGAIYYYTPLAVLRWDQVSPARFMSYAADLTRAGRPIYAIIFPFEEEEAFAAHLPGKWEKFSTAANRNVWRYFGPASPVVKP
jgi:hypothetical protein